MKERPVQIQPTVHWQKPESHSAQSPQQPEITSPSSSSRRAFIGTVVAGVVALPPLLSSKLGEARAQDVEPQAEIGPVSARKRAKQAFNRRVEMAQQQKDLPILDHPNNGDEDRYPNKIASFTKGLPHNSLGEVDLSAYNALIQAISTGRPADFEAIPLGSARKLINPQAALAFELEGPDSHCLSVPAAPAFASAQAAGEMVELFWHALARDVHFSDYDTNPLIARASADLSRLSDFRGPKAGGQVTSGTLFRADIPGVLTGPFLSQFLLKDINFGPLAINQPFAVPVPAVDYLITYDNWLASQNGVAPGQQQLESQKRYLRNGRDLARWVQVDVLFQAYFDAALILAGLRAPFDAANPYNTSRTQQSQGVLGALHIQSLVPAVATRAFKAIWYQKWSVHRRLRPEVFGGRIHNHINRAASYPIHSDVQNSQALSEVFGKNGTYLLPQAFVEGSPTHPSYLAGHAGLAGACVTVLKAFFDESFVIPNPAVPSADGLSLETFVGPPLTVGGELNKLGWNIAMGRDFGGIHYRSDQFESLKLGEEVAIRFLREEKSCFNESFTGFSLTKFDGTTITV